MKQEMDYIAKQRAARNDETFLVDEKGRMPDQIATAAQRKMVRVQSDHLIAALMNNSLPQLAAHTTLTMMMVATALTRCRTDTELRDFVLAAKELVEDARIVVDKALQVNEVEQVRIGAAMMEVVCNGICAILSLPYNVMLEQIHERVLHDLPVDDDWMWELLEQYGHRRPVPPGEDHVKE